MAVRRKNSSALSAQELLSRDNWTRLPSVAVLCGEAKFFKDCITRRFTQELFADRPREVRRLQGPPSEAKEAELPLHLVLDDLRTPSFLAPRRLVIVERADVFLRIHRDALTPYVESGFSGGHLLLELSGKLDKRTKFAKTITSKGWVVDCLQPFDRPPPWDDHSPVWDSPLTHWLVGHARSKELKIDPPTAFALHDRVGSDLSLLDEELEKIKTFLLAQGRSDISETTVNAVAGDFREDSMFSVVDLFLEGRRRDAVSSVERLFDRGYQNESGATVVEPASIALPLMGSLLSRLRALRRGHAMAAEGATSEDWIRAGIVKKPFLSRFTRQLKSTPLPQIRRLLQRLYATDRLIKSGGDPRRLVFLLVAQ